MTTTEAIDKWIEHEKFNTSYGRTVRNILYRNLGGLFPFIDASTLTEEHVSKGIDSMSDTSIFLDNLHTGLFPLQLERVSPPLLLNPRRKTKRN